MSARRPLPWILGLGLAAGPAAFAAPETAAPGNAAPGTPKTAPALPPGVTLLPRAEVPWTVAALALPLEAPPTPETYVLAALLDEPATWQGTPTGALLAAGGRLEAHLEPDGLVLVAEGPSEDLPAVLDAALALAQEPPSALPKNALALAQARALRRRVFDEADVRKRANSALWRAWYGESAPQEAFVADEMRLLRMEPSPLLALRQALGKAPGQALFVEGRLPFAKERAPVVLGHLNLPAAAPGALAPQAPVPGPARVVLEHPATRARRLVLGHPLPPAPELDGPFGEALLEVIRPALAPLPGATVELSHHRGATLLVFDVPLAAQQDPDAAESALRSALESLRANPPTARALVPFLERGRAKDARDRAALGQTARDHALRHLRFGDAAPGPETPEALRELLRLALLPEALRGVLVEAP